MSQFLVEYSAFLQHYEEMLVHLHVCRRARPAFAQLLEQVGDASAALRALCVDDERRRGQFCAQSAHGLTLEA